MGPGPRVMYPREASAFVASRAEHVKIDREAVTRVAPVLLSSLRRSNFRGSFSNVDVHPDPEQSNCVDWVFLISTLNFCFWHEEVEGGGEEDSSRYVVDYGGRVYSGYFALCAALKRAVDDGIDITNPSFYAKISREELSSIFRSRDANNRPVPLLDERIAALHDAGDVLISKFGGTAANLVAEADRSAEKLVKLVVENFASYKDEFEFEGHRIGIYKRAQIFVADLWACFDGQGYGQFVDVEFLTAFADYRVPQILETFGVLVYDKSLKQCLEGKILLASGSREEIEIRACTIHAVELLKEAILRLLPRDSDESKRLNSALLDHHLWDLCSSSDTVLRLPFHRTRSWFY